MRIRCMPWSLGGAVNRELGLPIIWSCAGGVLNKADDEQRPRDNKSECRADVREFDDQFLPWFAAAGACLTCGNGQHLYSSLLLFRRPND